LVELLLALGGSDDRHAIPFQLFSLLDFEKCAADLTFKINNFDDTEKLQHLP
jgi:hypothetical protein